MPSKLDEYLENAPEEQKAELDSIKAEMGKEGVHGKETATADLHATPNPENDVKYGGANEYDRPQAELKESSEATEQPLAEEKTGSKDSLSQYSLETTQEVQSQENTMSNDEMER